MATGVAVSGMEGVRKARGWLLGLGIVLILVGTLALGAAVFATIASVIFFGWLLLVAGAIEVGYAFSQPKWGGLILHVVNGVLGLVAGFILVLHPAAGALALTLLMAMFFMIAGLFRIVTMGLPVIGRRSKYGCMCKFDARSITAPPQPHPRR